MKNIRRHRPPRLTDRAQIVTLVALASIMLLSGTAAYLWHERARLLDAADERAVAQVQRLAEDLEKSLTVAEVAVQQVEQVVAGESVESLRQFWTTGAADLRAELLSTLPLPFQLHAIAERRKVIDLISDRQLERRDVADEMLRLDEASPGRWHAGNTTGSPLMRSIPLVWPARPNPQGIDGYVVDLSFAAVLARLEADRIKEGGGVALFRIGPGGQVSVLARAPFEEKDIGQPVKGHVAELVTSRAAGSFLTTGHFDSVERRVAFRRLAGTASEMVVVYGVSTQSVLSEWYRRLPAIGASTLALLLALGLGGWHLDRSVRRLQREVTERRALEQQRRQIFHDLDTVAKPRRRCSGPVTPPCSATGSTVAGWNSPAGTWKMSWVMAGRNRSTPMTGTPVSSDSGKHSSSDEASASNIASDATMASTAGSWTRAHRDTTPTDCSPATSAPAWT